MKKSINEKEQCVQTDVGGSVSHEVWLKKFEKTKEGKMFNLLHEYKSLNNPLSTGSINHLSYLSNALWIAVKGSKMESDAKEMINMICPDFFSDSHS